jgi:CO/xanthine dehydrogenase FAD-binding subunit
VDLSTVESLQTVRTRAESDGWIDGDAWLAGGTWLLSEPQPHLRRLRDLAGLGWAPVVVSQGGLVIAATCTIAQLTAVPLPAVWLAGVLVGQCARAFLSSFKIQHVATVGGNLCAALPAGPMISLAAALDGECEIWAGDRSWVVSAVDFVVGAPCSPRASCCARSGSPRGP